MECRTARDNLSALLDGALERELAEAIRRHIATCDECAASLAAMRAADADARNALRGVAEGAEPSGEFTARVLADIARREHKPLPLLWRPKVRRAALVAAAVVFIGLGTWTIVSNLHRPQGDEVIVSDEPPAPRRVVLTTLELPSVRDLVEEIFGQELLEVPAEPEELEHPQLNYKPSVVPTHWG